MMKLITRSLLNSLFPVTVAKTAQYTHHVPQSNHYDYDYGHYDAGHYDAGHYAGQYDAGHYY
jgi:hypothetical protein